jgi:branched-chain amino acid transport system substrate-binding protein
MLDTKGSPIEAVSRLQAAIARQKPDVVISALSPVAKAVRPIVEKEGILTLVTSTVLNDLARGTEQVVRLFANADDWTRPVAHYVQDHFKTLAVLHLQDDFGLSILNSMQRELAGSAVRIVSVNSFEMMQRDIRSLVLRALEGSPEAVYVIGYGPAYINIIKQVRQSDPALTVLADATFSDPAVLTALGAAAEGVIYDGMDFNLENPVFDRSVRFREYYLQTWGRLPYAPAGLTYDALQAVVQAAYRDGRFGQPNKAQVIELSPLQGVVGNVSIDADGESSFPYILVRQERGKAVQVPGY